MARGPNRFSCPRFSPRPSVLLERHFAETQSAPHAVRLPITFAARCEYVQREPQDKASERRTMATIEPIETLRLRSLVAYLETIGDLARRR